MSLLVDQLGGLGLLDHPAVLVHSSLKGLGLTEHGGPVFSPAEVIEQLMTAAGSDTTVLFPTLTYSPDHGPTSPPHTDLRHAAALTGAIPEAGRLAAGRHRSLHPTHSVAALGGGDPGRWVAGHERTSSPCGVGSPYARLIEEGGAILLLGGVSSDSNTTLHCLEELAQVPYHLQSDLSAGEVVDFDGTTVEVPNRLHLWGWDRWFTRADPELRAAGLWRQAQVGASTAVLIDAAALAGVLLPRLSQNPLYLLTEQAAHRFRADDARLSPG